MTETELVDRRNGLIVFGVLMISLGLLCALFVPLLLFAMSLPDQSGALQLTREMVLAVTSAYGSAAAILVWLGIGSVLCRRWARALILILAWSWLLAGVMLVPALIGLSPAVALAAGVPYATDLMVIVAVIVAIPMIFLPGGMILFYASKSVKATCEARDPKPRWTDACPPAVLATALWFLVSALISLLTALAPHCVVPFFGILLTGGPAAALCLGLAALWTYLAWQSYRLRPAGWWGTLATTVALPLSIIVTVVKTDPMEMFRRLGYTAQQVGRIQSAGVYSERNIVLVFAVFSILFLIYLIPLRKHFK